MVLVSVGLDGLVVLGFGWVVVVLMFMFFCVGCVCGVELICGF